MTQSNRLPTLADEARQAHAESLHHSQKAAERALVAGSALVEAKALCAHGTWGDWLAQTGIPERSAQRYMKLHSAGLKSDTVSDLGGIKASLAFVSKWVVPGSDEALHIEIGEGNDINFAFVYRDSEHPDCVNIAAVVGGDFCRTKKPMLPFAEVDGSQPVDTIITWLREHAFGPIADWRVASSDLHSAMEVINPIVWFTMVDEAACEETEAVR
jgi:hypothetical protein